MSHLFVLHLSGPPCSGKSTLEAALSERLTGTYVVSFDKMKWQLAGYDRGKDGPLVDQLVMGLFGIVCKKKIPVILDFSFASKEEYEACRQFAEQEGYTFVSVELTAPTPILLERFHRRIAEAKISGAKITLTDESTFLETAARKFYLPAGTTRFDTSAMGIEEIATQVIGSL